MGALGWSQGHCYADEGVVNGWGIAFVVRLILLGLLQPNARDWVACRLSFVTVPEAASRRRSGCWQDLERDSSWLRAGTVPLGGKCRGALWSLLRKRTNSIPKGSKPNHQVRGSPTNTGTLGG